MANPHPVEGMGVALAEESRKSTECHVESIHSDEKVKICEEEKLKVSQQFFTFSRLIFAASPKATDYVLLIVGFLGAIVAGVPFPLLAILFGQVIDDINAATCLLDKSAPVPGDYQADVNSKVLLVLYLAIAQFIFMYAHLSCWSMVGGRLAQRLREEYLRSVLRQEVAFFDTLPAGEISSRLDGDIQTIRAGTSEKVGLCISSISFFVTAYVVSFIKEANLAGMLASLIPAYFLLAFVGTYYIEKFASLVSDATAAATAVISEALSNIPIVQAFSAEQRLETKVAGSLRSARTNGVNKAIATGLQAGFMYFIAYAANGLAFWQGSRNIANSVETDGTSATVGATYTVIFVLVDATLILSQVAPFFQMFGSAAGSFRKLSRDMNRVTLLDGLSEDRGSKPEIEGTVDFEDVSFAYPSRPRLLALKNATFTFPAGKHTAIIGLSGSGKSTVAGLVTRLYAPTDGAIKVDGHDVKDVNIRHLRGYIALVQQEPVLLDRSIFENIALGLVSSPNPEHVRFRPLLVGPQIEKFAEDLRRNAGQSISEVVQSWNSSMQHLVKLVIEAARLADAEAFIQRLDEGYGTLVGTSGKSFSGGQRQRCALARAIIKDPKILILDEATAALDSASEKRVIGAIGKLGKRRTIISIAHRLATARNVDNIIVMRDGSVIEQGDHEVLLAKNGAYAELVRLQAMRTGDDPVEDFSSSVSRFSADRSTDKSDTQKEDGHSVAEYSVDDGNKSVTLTRQESDDEAITSKRSLSSIIIGLARLVRRDALIILVALTGSVVVGAAYSAESVIFGNTVSQLNTCRSADRIRSSGRFFGLMFVILAIVELFANVISWSGFGYMAEKLLYRVRIASFRTLLKQNLHWHHSGGRSPAKLLSVITRDGAALNGLSGSVIGTILSIVINLIIAVTLTLIVAWKIALVCIATVPLLLAAGLMELRVLSNFDEKHESAYSASVAIAVEAVSSIKTISALSLENEVMESYLRKLAPPKKEMTKASLHACLWLSMTYFIGTLSYALAFWWGSKQIIAGNYSQAQFIIVVFSLLVSAQLWSQMFALAPEISSARAAVARILNLLDLEDRDDHNDPDNDHDSGAQNLDPEKGTESLSTSTNEKTQGMGVQFEDVVFAYPSRLNTNILKGLNLTIPAGKFCALVGPSGAGKSTIINLIERLYAPKAGKIRLDGLDITRTNSLSFRNEIALVPQDSALFEGTIRFNILLGARKGQLMNDDEIQEACKLANIHDRICTLPKGYETECGNNGGMLSGGERQRLAIARALVRKPRLLILDESTSALDAESESLLQKGLDRVRDWDGGITVIAIAHRLNTIRKADVIFVVDEGQVVDCGRHEELFARNEMYRKNAMHQMF